MYCFSGTVIQQTAINNFGYLIFAGHITTRKLFSFILMPLSILGLAMSTFVSQNKEAG